MMKWTKVACPICKAQLDLGAKSLKCERNHSYDISKEGYCNLLIANQKKSKDPGDNKLMIDARRAFLELGKYDFLIDEIKKLITQTESIFDAGCGEGYYLNKLSKKLGYGMDISKSAIKNAAKKYKNHHFFVGSVHNIPIVNDTFDTIISIFSPTNFKEFHRILTENGKVILVTAAPNHMKSIAEMVYDKFKPHTQKTSFDYDNGYTLESDNIIEQTITLESNQDIMNLLKMTPYYWNTVPKKLVEFEKLTKIDIGMSFRIRVFLKQII